MQKIGVILICESGLQFAIKELITFVVNPRRSEWPTATYVHPSFASIEPEISPVYAPELSVIICCAIGEP
jgi:hypothetical protein